MNTCTKISYPLYLWYVNFVPGGRNQHYSQPCAIEVHRSVEHCHVKLWRFTRDKRLGHPSSPMGVLACQHMVSWCILLYCTAVVYCTRTHRCTPKLETDGSPRQHLMCGKCTKYGTSDPETDRVRPLLCLRAVYVSIIALVFNPATYHMCYSITYWY